MDISAELVLAHNLFGRLSPAIQERLQRVVDNPTRDNWEDAYCIILNADFTTLWQAVLVVDPTFPHVGTKTDRQGNLLKDWERIPDQETLVEALKWATH